MITMHIAHGITGYGPDFEPDDMPIEGIREICDAIRWELERDADMLEDGAAAMAESGDYESAWKGHTRANELLALAVSLDWDRRATAPAYVDNVPALEENMLRIIGESFPLEISSGPAITLYVWEPTDQVSAPRGATRDSDNHLVAVLDSRDVLDDFIL